MSITADQRASAEQKQWDAARDSSSQTRVVAGPGTGKTHTIEKRVAHVLASGATPSNVCVISFTRATSAELQSRILAFCANNSSYEGAAHEVHVSTMHSLALKILRRGNLLTEYPSDPIVIDDWEQKNIYDSELSIALGCRPRRAADIRLAHDAQWQTLDPAWIDQAQITSAEKRSFNAFHASRTNLYSCVLPGELIYKCVEAIRQGRLQLAQLFPIEHLIVDEFQDLNACDQEFVKFLCEQGAILFVAGDDDQSIYSFRHANPDVFVAFDSVYPKSARHDLYDCFRCTPSILKPASRMIAYNPGRLEKNLISLYESAAPPVQGSLFVWSFPSAQVEARSIAESCKMLINEGMTGREDNILILISNRRVQLDIITQELSNLGLPFDPPRDEALTEYEEIRALYSILRIVKDNEAGQPDYLAHRTLLALLSGVGPATASEISDLCITNNQNFHNLFYQPNAPHWLNGRARSAVERLMATVRVVGTWSLEDTLETCTADIVNIFSEQIFTASRQLSRHIDVLNALFEALPEQMTIEELIELLAAKTESEQQLILEKVNQRISHEEPSSTSLEQKKIRILTMHGAKGLSGKIVFIPSAEQGIIPSFRNLNATGLVMEHRRLFYVSLTRAMAACIISHAAVHSGPSAFVLQQSATVRLPRSQFLNEMNVNSQNRANGLSATEASKIVSDINNL